MLIPSFIVLQFEKKFLYIQIIMREIQFIEANKAKWKEFEHYLNGQNNSLDPDRLAELYINVTDDLSYTQTFYPSSKLLHYLNGLSVKAHQKIYANKKEKTSRFITFWKYEVPLAVKQSYPEITAALVIFLVAIAIGMFSSSQDAEYLKLIVGDNYVNVTQENIDKGDPMAIYKSASSEAMFAKIAINNVRVSLMAFAVGILTSIMPAFILMFNGIMVGAFLYHFVHKGLIGIALSTIFIHGALELSCIVFAGGAGIVLGNSMLFPKTYSRIDSIIMGAKRALKIMIGLLPIIVAAAFIESYFTRHYMEMGSIGRLAIIILSFAFIIWYFIIYPRQINLNEHQS
jgi:uncharacterized membrane protein SpoIIM required for sporulation